MPKTKRDLLKRQLAHAYNNCDLAGAHLQQIIVAFEPVHPELAEPLVVAQQTLLAIMEVMRKFADVSWGIIDPPWDSWRNVPRREEDLPDTPEE